MAGGRKSRPAPPAPPSKTLVVDNGASTIKAGFVTADSGDASHLQPRIVPNCIARDRSKKTYVADELENCKDYSDLQYRRPADRGYIVNWEAQREIWNRQFFDENAPLYCDPTETRLLMCEPPNNLPVLQTNCDQIVFEEYGFASYYRGIGPTFNAYHDVRSLFSRKESHKSNSDPPKRPAEVMLVVDSGYSHTTVTPTLAGRPLNSGIRRLDVGGKLLTNYLARLLSLRHYDMRSETTIVNEMKEAACYVSSDFKLDLETSWKGTRGEKRQAWLTGGGIAKDYILPDFHKRYQGQIVDYDPARHSKAKRVAAAAQPEEDVLTLRNERFAVPELIFNPSDMGMRQPGLPDLIHQSLQTLPIGLWPGLLNNIVVVGGNCHMDGFVHRLWEEVMQRFPDDCVVGVARPFNAIVSTWQGAAHFSQHPDMESFNVTKQDYEEIGASGIARRLAKGLKGG